MLKFPLGSDDAFLILAPRWAEWGSGMQFALLLLTLLVPVALVIGLYRWELRLISLAQACGLLMLRLLMIVVLWAAVAFQPHFADREIEEQPSRVRIAVDLSTSMDVTDVQQTSAERERLARALKLSSTEDVATLTRKAIVARMLSVEGINLLRRLTDQHQVEIVGFHQQATTLQPAQLLEKLASAKVSQEPFGTDWNLPLAEVSSSRRNPLLGIVVFSDGQHNVGSPPFDRAEDLGKQRVPIFPVVVGSRNPPNDLMILDVQAPTKAFRNATVGVEVRCQVANMPAQDLTVTMQIGGKPIQPEHRQTIKHRGTDDVYTVRFQAKMEEVGTQAISVQATSTDQKEITLANNQMARVIRVGEEKVRMLLIDGEVRWEYHYVATALARDPTLEFDRVVFSQPRIGMVKEPMLEKLGYARTKLPEAKALSKDVDPLMEYDCVLLGDVSPDQLPIADRERLEKYVAKRGGTLILMAGKRHLPLAFSEAGDPLGKMLPITSARVFEHEQGFALKATTEGKQRPFLLLEPDQTSFTWPELPRHYWGIVGKPKPAASVLLTPTLDDKPISLKEENDTGIVVQQNYGFGRVLFVGLDSTWRWRWRVGDLYHHRFWGQLARWSAADKLLPAGNKLIRYGPREPVYAEGEEVALAVRVGGELPALKDAREARARLLRRNADGTEELVAVVPLSENPRQKNLLEAKVRDLAAGTFRMELAIPAYREALAAPNEDKDPPLPDLDLFRVLPRPPREMLDLSTNVPLLQTLANNSDGKLYTPEDVEQLLERLARRIERTEHSQTRKPWQDEPMVWWLLGLLLGLLTLEWTWRRWLELA